MIISIGANVKDRDLTFEFKVISIFIFLRVITLTPHFLPSITKNHQLNATSLAIYDPLFIEIQYFDSILSMQVY